MAGEMFRGRIAKCVPLTNPQLLQIEIAQESLRHPATDRNHTPVKELLRNSLQGYLGGDTGAYGNLLRIAGLPDQHEAIAKKGGTK